jgi:two-component system LytT family response regulator
VKTGDQYVMQRVADIDWIEADDNYARLHIAGRARLINKTLATLERDVLDPSVFVRVHRSAIVNMSRVVAAESLFRGELTLVLRDGSRVKCSRRHRKDIEGRFYFTT